MIKLQDVKTGIKMSVAAGVPLVFLLVVGVVSFINIQKIVKTEELVNHTYVVLSEVDAIVGATVDMETGMRGFLLSGKDDFLDPYKSGEKKAYAELTKMKKIVSDEPEQVARISEVEKTLRDWQQNVAEPAIDQRRQVGAEQTMDGIIAMVVEDKGKVYLDKFRKVMGEFKSIEQALMAERKTANHSTISTTYKVISTLLLLAFALGGFIAWVIGRGMTKPLEQMVGVLSMMADGKKRSIPSLEAKDEIGDIARAVSDIDKISQNAVRVQTSLDAVTSSVMVADADNNVVYMNPSVTKMLENAEEDIRKDLPDFDSRKVLGGSIDRFHKNPKHQQSMLTRLTSTYETSIEVGGRTFELTANPVFDSDGARMGTVVEWKDLTAQIEVQRQSDIMNSTMAGMASNVIIVNNDDNIQYANNASITNLTRLTDDIRGQFPNFDVNKLMGGNIHQFHKNPDRIKEILRDLKPGQQHRANIQIGPVTLSLNAGGVFDGDGNRMGSYVEWSDVTESVAREKREKEAAESKAQVEADVTSVANMINDATRDIAQGNVNLSERTEAQAASIEETTATMQQITERVNEGAENAKQALGLSSSARDAADRGGRVVKDAINAMAEISASSTKISDIIGVIDEIAFQTNLLALNAAVEAARAGEQGRGFAVVASEVRTLAGRSATAAKEIKDLINESVDKVKTGTNQVNETGDCLSDIIMNVQQVAEMVGQISEGSQEQALSITEINKSVNQMDSFTQQNAALVEEAASASKSLEEQAANLVGVINGKASRPTMMEAATEQANGAAIEEASAEVETCPMPKNDALGDDQAWMDA